MCFSFFLADPRDRRVNEGKWYKDEACHAAQFEGIFGLHLSLNQLIGYMMPIPHSKYDWTHSHDIVQTYYGNQNSSSRIFFKFQIWKTNSFFCIFRFSAKWWQIQYWRVVAEIWWVILFVWILWRQTHSLHLLVFVIVNTKIYCFEAYSGRIERVSWCGLWIIDCALLYGAVHFQNLWIKVNFEFKFG